MAKQQQLSTTIRNAKANAVISGVGATGQLRIYDDSAGVPTDCAAAPVGTLLVQFVLGNPFAPAPSNGVISPTLPASATPSNTGKARYYRVYDNAGTTCHIQGEVGAGLGLVLSNSNLVSGGSAAISSWTITEAGA